MSGHSKWSKIKRQKEVNDLEKSNIFAKLSRAITLAVVESGGITDPTNNVRLRLQIEKAKELNLPKENIKRAIEKGVSAESAQLKHVLYEAFGPNGAVFLIEGSTDNLNRTMAEVRNTLERKGAKLGSPGSVAYLFRHIGEIAFDVTVNSEEKIMEFANEVKALDFEEEGSEFYVFFPPDQLGHITQKLGDLKLIVSQSLLYQPLTYVNLDENKQKEVYNIVRALEDLEDIAVVHTNVNFSLLNP